jgi:hypothetical protein
MRNLWLRLASVAAVLATGCSAPIPEAPPAAYDSAAITQALLSTYDKNKNGALDGSELDACPALRHGLAAIDKNRDKSLAASELQERVERYAALGKVPVTCLVQLDDRGLSGATITLEPDKCMGPGLKTATAKTEQDGTASSFEVDGKSFTTLAPGLYWVRITKEGLNLPARYNTQTTLGREVFPDPRTGEAAIEIALKVRKE